MCRVAIVEDQREDSDALLSYINRYARENNLVFETVLFANGLNFLDEYTADFDIVFMDVEMPHLDGIETARKLRERDEDVVLIFVTNMIQYAINGYEVNAVDFMVKPVSYYNFSRKLQKAVQFTRQRDAKQVILRNEGVVTVLHSKDIYYIESDKKNYLLFHTKKGDFRERGTLADIAGKLLECGFSKCYASYLVNLPYVDWVEDNRLSVNGDIIPVSRRLKKDFMMDFARYFGGVA